MTLIILPSCQFTIKGNNYPDFKKKNSGFHAYVNGIIQYALYYKLLSFNIMFMKFIYVVAEDVDHSFAFLLSSRSVSIHLLYY